MYNYAELNQQCNELFVYASRVGIKDEKLIKN